MPSAGAFIPVRLDSERLPRKALSKIAGKTVLEHLIHRIEAVKQIVSKRDIVVCTTTDSSDDDLQKLANEVGVSCFRGEKNDLIKRFYDANQIFNFEEILQIDGDDPLVPPEYSELTLEKLCNEGVDVACTKDLMFGLNVKAFTRQALHKVYEAYETLDNETGFGLYFLNEELCHVEYVEPTKSSHSNNKVRLTLDYPEDLAVISAVIRSIPSSHPAPFSADALVGVLEEHEHLRSINWKRQRDYQVRGTARRNPFLAVINGRKIEF